METSTIIVMFVWSKKRDCFFQAIRLKCLSLNLNLEDNNNSPLLIAQRELVPVGIHVDSRETPMHLENRLWWASLTYCTAVLSLCSLLTNSLSFSKHIYELWRIHLICDAEITLVQCGSNLIMQKHTLPTHGAAFQLLKENSGVSSYFVLSVLEIFRFKRFDFSPVNVVFVTSGMWTAEVGLLRSL